MTPRSILHASDRPEDASAPTTVDAADTGSPEDEEDAAAAHAADAPSEEEEEEEDAVGAATTRWCWSACRRVPGPPAHRRTR